MKGLSYKGRNGLDQQKLFFFLKEQLKNDSFPFHQEKIV